MKFVNFAFLHVVLLWCCIVPKTNPNRWVNIIPIPGTDLHCRYLHGLKTCRTLLAREVISVIVEWDKTLQDSLRKELDFYNTHRGDRPEISWKEALLSIQRVDVWSLKQSLFFGAKEHASVMYSSSLEHRFVLTFWDIKTAGRIVGAHGLLHQVLWLCRGQQFKDPRICEGTRTPLVIDQR